MRKTIALLAVLIGAFGVIDLAGASPASAASCSASTGAISRYVDSGFQVMGYNATISNCSQVEAVRWQFTAGSPFGAGHHTGFVDCTENGGSPCGEHAGYINGAQVDWTLLNPGSGANSVWVAQTCWYAGTHAVQAGFYFQIKNSVTHTWGSTAFKGANPFVNVTC